jgi:hypothetical protein
MNSADPFRKYMLEFSPQMDKFYKGDDRYKQLKNNYNLVMTDYKAVITKYKSLISKKQSLELRLRELDENLKIVNRGLVQMRQDLVDNPPRNGNNAVTNMANQYEDRVITLNGELYRNRVKLALILEQIAELSNLGIEDDVRVKNIVNEFNNFKRMFDQNKKDLENLESNIKSDMSVDPETRKIVKKKILASLNEYNKTGYGLYGLGLKSKVKDLIEEIDKMTANQQYELEHKLNGNSDREDYQYDKDRYKALSESIKVAAIMAAELSGEDRDKLANKFERAALLIRGGKTPQDMLLKKMKEADKVIDNQIGGKKAKKAKGGKRPISTKQREWIDFVNVVAKDPKYGGMKRSAIMSIAAKKKAKGMRLEGGVIVRG